MSIDDTNKVNWLFPVQPENMDVVLDVKWYDSSYIAYECENDDLNWFVSCVKDKVFLEVNDDPSYFEQHGKIPKPTTWHTILDHFRALRYNDKLMYVSGCHNYLTDNIFAARGNYIYPSETTLIHVLVSIKDYSERTLKCKCIDIDGSTCVVIGNSAFDLVAYFDSTQYLIARLPLGVLATEYQYGWMDGSIYDLPLAASTSKASLINMPDEIRAVVFKTKGEENV